MQEAKEAMKDFIDTLDFKGFSTAAAMFEATKTMGEVGQFQIEDTDGLMISAIFNIVQERSAYQGFNIALMQKMLFASFRQHSELTDAEDLMEGFKKEMVLLLSLLATRGTSIVSDAKMETMSEEGKKLVKGLKGKYHLVPNLKGTKVQKSMCVTLGRVAACFPALNVQLYRHFTDDVKVISLSTFAQKYAGFTHDYRTSSWFALLLPTVSSDIIVTLMKAIANYIYDESEVLNAKDANYASKSPTAKMNQIMIYVKAASFSKAVPDDTRKAFTARIRKNLVTAQVKFSDWSTEFNKLFSAIDFSQSIRFEPAEGSTSSKV